jgi:hypothetical protein
MQDGVFLDFQPLVQDMEIMHVDKPVNKASAVESRAKFSMLPICAGLAVLHYWIVFGIDFFEDLHYSYHWLGFLLKWLLPVVLLVNIIGLAGALKRWPCRPVLARTRLLALVLNAVPPLLFFLMLFWLFFLFRI